MCVGVEPPATSPRFDQDWTDALPPQSSPSAEHRRLAAVLHDVRAPLSGIQALTEALEDDVIEPTKRALCLRQLESLAMRLLHLTQDLSPHSGGGSTTTISVATLASEAVVLAQVMAEVKGVSLAVAVVDEDSLVSVSPERIVRAIDNILENAVRHTSAGAEIRVTVTSRQD